MRLLPEIRNLIGNYHVKSGVYHYYRNEYNQAVSFLRKALREDPELAAADLRRARHYLALALMDSAARHQLNGDAEQAIEQLRAAAEVSPGFADIHFRLGRLLEERGEARAAAGEFRQATRTNPRYLEAHVALGFCLIGLGSTDEAVAAMKKALQIKLEKLKTPFEAGLAALASGKAAEARERLHEVFLAEARLAAECVRTAQNLLRAEDFEAALAELDQAIALHPRYPDVHNFRGIALCELGRNEEAIEAFGVSAALSPGYLVPRLNLAFAWLRADDLQEAEAALKAVLEIDPTETAAAAKLDELNSVRVPEKRRSATRGTVR